MTRAEHVAWAKERAMAYADQGDTTNTITSLASDLGKHPDTADHGAIMLGTMLAMSGKLATVAQLREFVQGVS